MRNQVDGFISLRELSDIETSITPGRWLEIGDVFEKVLELPVEEREDFLARACVGDPQLRKEVESLIERADTTGLSSQIGSSIQQSAASLLSARSDIQPGKTMGNYVVLEKIGEGGMGMVFKARDVTLQRTVALKLLPDLPGERRKNRLRFLQEARAAAALDHPNICTIYEIDQSPDGVPFISMAYYGGETLNEKIKREAPLPVSLVRDYAIQTLDGLAHAHEHGIVHRDIKPANIFVTSQGQVKILDFGVAKVAEATITQPGIVMGTLAYMSPEQASGDHVDARSDLFSLGAILYEMLTGRRPPPGSFRTQADQPPATDRLCTPDVPEELGKIVARAMEKDRNLRYQNAAEMRIALQRLQRDGAQKFQHVSEPLNQPSVTNRRSMTVRSASVAFLVIVLLAAGVLHLRQKAKRPTPVSISGKAAVAILPFRNMSADKEQEYFSDGLTEELTDMLAKNPRLKVISRTSAFSFKGKDADINTIAQALNVSHVVEGSVRKAGNRLRITAQLIEVGTDSHLWSQTYEREMDNIFAVQDEIAASVAAALNATLEGSPDSKAQQATPEAYNAFLQGRYFLDRGGNENLERAILYFQEALRLDSDYARAWVGLSNAHSRQADCGDVFAEEGYAMAREEVETALKLNPELAEAYGRLGQIKWSYDWDWAGADVAFNRALQLDPENAEVVRWAARLAGTLGDFDRAITLDRKSIELDPVRAALYANLGLHYGYAGRWEEAEAALNKALELNPEYWFARYVIGRIHLAQSKLESALAHMEKEPEPAWRGVGLAVVYHALGRREEADAALADYIAKFQYTWAFQVAEIYAYRGEKDKAFDWLERAYVQHDPGLTYIKGDWLLRNLADDPRYSAFLKKMKLPHDEPVTFGSIKF